MRRSRVTKHGRWRCRRSRTTHGTPRPSSTRLANRCGGSATLYGCGGWWRPECCSEETDPRASSADANTAGAALHVDDSRPYTTDPAAGFDLRRPTTKKTRAMSAHTSRRSGRAYASTRKSTAGTNARRLLSNLDFMCGSSLIIERRTGNQRRRFNMQRANGGARPAPLQGPARHDVSDAAHHIN